MPFDESPIIEASIHDFKTNFSKYLRECEERRAQGIAVFRRQTMVGLFFPNYRLGAGEGEALVKRKNKPRH